LTTSHPPGHSALATRQTYNSHTLFKKMDANLFKLKGRYSSKLS